MRKLILLALAVAASAAATLIGSSSALAWCNPEYSDCEPPATATSAPDSGLHEVARTPGGVYVGGYAIDPDTIGPIDAKVLIDGVETGTVTADDFYVSNVLRLVFPGHGDYHGLRDVAPARAGSQVCIDPVDFDANGPADQPLAGNRSCLGFAVRVDPFGAFEALTVQSSGLRLRGWALDPDTASPVTVEVYRDGAFVTSVLGDVPRAGLSPPGHSGYGALHGFDVVVPIVQGDHTLCVRAVNVGAGTASAIGCRSYGPPATPTLRSVEANEFTWLQLGVTWQDNADDEAGFRLERSASGAAWGVAKTLPPYSGRGQKGLIVDYPLSSGTGYCYRMVAWSVLGETSSGVRCATTLQPPLPRPTDVQIRSISSTKATIEWRDNAASEDWYRIDVARGPKTAVNVQNLVTKGQPFNAVSHVGSVATWTIAGLSPETEYCFQVIVGKAGHASASSALTWAELVCATTAPRARIDGFTASPALVQACSPSPITLEWDVTGASRLAIFRGATMIRELTAPQGGQRWQGSITDPVMQDLDVEYKLVVYDLDGANAASDTAAVRATSPVAFAKSVFIRNITAETLSAWFYTNLDFPISEIGKIAPGGTLEVKLPHCQFARIKTIRPDNSWKSDMTLLGHTNAGSLSTTVG